MGLFDEYFFDLRTEHSDFDTLEGSECAIAIPCEDKSKGERYTVCMIWDALIALKQLLDSSAVVELEANGLEKGSESVAIEDKVIYDGEKVPQSKLSNMGVTATSIVFSYKEWKEKRERLLQGKAGAFYDFEELTVVIKNICVLLNAVTYADLYGFLKRMVQKFNGRESRVIDPFVLWLEDCTAKLKAAVPTVDGEGLFQFNEKQTSIQQLEVWYNNSKSGRIYALAFICFKLKGLVTVEQNIAALQDNTFERVGV